MAKALGRKVKLVARSYQADGKVFKGLSPSVEAVHPLASICGVYNCSIREIWWMTLCCGKGAGKESDRQCSRGGIMTAARYFSGYQRAAIGKRKFWI
ncbi:MAG: hypothetical protein ACLTXL_14630 [Clostridia bacterium]